eukprot:1599806-Prymnesium_polylepis.1
MPNAAANAKMKRDIESRFAERGDEFAAPSGPSPWPKWRVARPRGRTPSGRSTISSALPSAGGRLKEDPPVRQRGGGGS